MTENTEPAGGISDRRAPKRNRVGLAELTLIVRLPGRAGADSCIHRRRTHGEAHAYASETGASVDNL